MFTVIVTTHTDIHVLSECTGYYYDEKSDTLRITKNYGKAVFCFPYREILHYVIKDTKEK